MPKQSNTTKIWQKGTIMATLTGLIRPSANKKTGPMLQIATLDTRDSPTQIIKKKLDSSVCGDCALKRTVCYVNPISLNGVWKSAVNQVVSKLPEKLGAVRFGTYGNPSKLPLALIKTIASKATSWTGYCHDWETVSPQYAKYFMASIDDLSAKKKGRSAIEDKAVANKLGYRTYRTIRSVKELLPDEIHCPHEEKGVKCIDCKLCSGNNSKAKNIAITIGGPSNKQVHYHTHSKENG
tara:strand:- start:514 stop:1227 length:714 start_codon:yes stop_codon:yes gene_type:complete